MSLEIARVRFEIYFCIVSKCERLEQTFDVALEELGQDAVGGQLVKHTAQELLGHTCHIPRDQHAATHHRTETGGHTSHLLLNSSI